MTDLYAVVVRTPNDGRFIDSYWIEAVHASARMEMLKSSLVAAGRPISDGAWKVTISTLRIEDADVVPAPPYEVPSEGKPAEC